MTAASHSITIATRWVSVAQLGRVEQFRAECVCGVDLPWGSQEMAVGHGSRHRAQVAA